ncbi:hypothetical protein ACFO1B_55480, partial [Dactylosporangium siamense]|uniref:hypothetical protein n=1 Tax=Dactylosporangium siamense TaxID=685454 RepID=UPI0036159EFB
QTSTEPETSTGVSPNPANVPGQSTSSTPAEAIDRICGNVDRDLTSDERAMYLPSTDSGSRACPHTPG